MRPDREHPLKLTLQKFCLISILSTITKKTKYHELQLDLHLISLQYKCALNAYSKVSSLSSAKQDKWEGPK
jgi:cytochrome c oxidase subunit IV